MDKIASFSINHDKLLPGIYVSRKDHVGQETLTTFDIRFKRPNVEPPMETSAMHTYEHLGATFLRNDPEWKDRTIYFGPMGCRTGFYVIFSGDLESKDIVDVVRRMCEYVMNFEGVIPGTVSRDCGNYLDHNLAYTKCYTETYMREFLDCVTEDRLVYPE